MTGFQFLRPEWLLVLLLVPLVVWLLHRRAQGFSEWQRVIPPALLTPLLPGDVRPSGQRRWGWLVPPLLLTLLALALAGPSFRSVPTSLQQQDDAVVVVLDLSLSMLATDVKPDRLTRAIRKIRDLLAAREGAFTGLVVYAADAHVVTPLTDDRRTVEGLLAALDPLIMPAAGNRADLGVARATELLEQGTSGQGRVLLITDRLKERYADAIQSQLADTPWQLNGLMVGTANGSPIPIPNHGFIRDGNEVVISRAFLAELEQTARMTGGQAMAMTTTNTDLARLQLRASDSDGWREAHSDRTANTRQDDGYWLLWLVMPLALLGWRRGALLMVTCALVWLPPRPALALDWQDLWQTPEQRAPELIRQDPEAAARKLNDSQWRGTALFRDDQYQSAADAFASGDSANAHYNRGVALAHAGEAKAAQAAFEQALALDPEHDRARHNLELVEQFLKQQQNKSGQAGNKQQSQSQGQGQNQGDPSQAGGTGAGGDANYPPQPPSSPPAAEPDDSDRPGGSRGQPGTQPPAGETEARSSLANGGGANTRTEQELGVRPAPDSGQGQLTQSQEQWLRRIPDNPGGLLKRKFLQQSRDRNTQTDESDTPW